MESRHRDELKRVLMEEWASHDPKGFLIAWKDRAWPDGMWNGPASLAMEKLARLSPELLLEFARTEGCDAAWLAYLAAAHPLSSLKLLNETKKGELPENVMEALVMRGMEIDPEFHRHLERINDPELRDEALIVVATSMFATRRLDELAPIIKTLNPTGKPEEKLVNIAAAQMMEGDLSLSELQVLPEEFLSKVIVAFLNHETPQYRGLELSIEETINWVDDLVQTGWAQGREKDILRFVEKYSSVGELRIHSKETDEATLRREYSAKWLHVVDKIPAELGEIKIPLIMTAIHFHQSSPAELQTKIADADIRDYALAYLATFDPSALEIIDSPMIRDRTTDYLEWKKQHPLSEDPFAPEPEYTKILPWIRQDAD